MMFVIEMTAPFHSLWHWIWVRMCADLVLNVTTDGTILPAPFLLLRLKLIPVSKTDPCSSNTINSTCPVSLSGLIGIILGIG